MRCFETELVMRRLDISGLTVVVRMRLVFVSFSLRECTEVLDLLPIPLRSALNLRFVAFIFGAVDAISWNTEIACGRDLEVDVALVMGVASTAAPHSRSPR